MKSRADKIFEMLERVSGHRLKASEIKKRLAKIEGIKEGDLNPSIVPATIRNDNNYRKENGRVVRFNIYGSGDEEWGYVSLLKTSKAEASKSAILNNYVQQIPNLIEEANSKTKEALNAAIQKLNWVEFESSFMESVLAKLGFTSIEITQRTRDGGKDGNCKYTRGLVETEAMISAKHWKSASVGPEEVQRMRGLKGHQDTAIIFTSSRFTSGAVAEAKPSQNQRSVVLIDGNTIVETCFSNGIGIKAIQIPPLYQFEGFDKAQE